MNNIQITNSLLVSVITGDFVIRNNIQVIELYTTAIFNNILAKKRH